nr:hypothetical protein [uncultured Dongia sp.]
MKLVLDFSAVGWLTVLSWFPRLRPSRRSEGREHRVRFEDLSPHVLRDLGFSTHDARDMVATERSRLLS